MTLSINQKPVSVSYTCCDCGAEITEPFDDFCLQYGDNPYDSWEGVLLTCPGCNTTDSVEDFTYE